MSVIKQFSLPKLLRRSSFFFYSLSISLESLHDLVRKTYSIMVVCLLDLPPEIRLYIYAYVFPKSQRLERYTTMNKSSETALIDRFSILRVCKLTYREAMPILYANNLLVMDAQWIRQDDNFHFWDFAEPVNYLKKLQVNEFNVLSVGIVNVLSSIARRGCKLEYLSITTKEEDVEDLIRYEAISELGTVFRNTKFRLGMIFEPDQVTAVAEANGSPAMKKLMIKLSENFGSISTYGFLMTYRQQGWEYWDIKPAADSLDFENLQGRKQSQWWTWQRVVRSKT